MAEPRQFSLRALIVIVVFAGLCIGMWKQEDRVEALREQKRQLAIEFRTREQALFKEKHQLDHQVLDREKAHVADLRRILSAADQVPDTVLGQAWASAVRLRPDGKWEHHTQSGNGRHVVDGDTMYVLRGEDGKNSVTRFRKGDWERIGEFRTTHRVESIQLVGGVLRLTFRDEGTDKHIFTTIPRGPAARSVTLNIESQLMKASAYKPLPRLRYVRCGNDRLPELSGWSPLWNPQQTARPAKAGP